jgi:hypothetical protein
MNKSLLFKIGILLFVYTIIIGFHLKDNSYYKIKTNTQLQRLINVGKDHDITIITFRPEEYLTKEKYFLILQTSDYKNTIIKQTEQKILPFEASLSLFISLMLIVAFTIIISSFSISNLRSEGFKKTAILTSLIAVFWVYNIYDKPQSSDYFKLSNETELKSEISTLNSNYDDLNSAIENLSNRVDDLENY